MHLLYDTGFHPLPGTCTGMRPTLLVERCTKENFHSSNGTTIFGSVCSGTIQDFFCILQHSVAQPTTPKIVVDSAIAVAVIVDQQYRDCGLS